MASAPARTPLFDWHVAHGGRMVPFAGWSMPVQYTSIVDEHRATRQRVVLFDISHMGRFRLDGSASLDLLDRLLTRRVADLRPGHVRYSLVTNDAAGVLDDVLVYFIQADGGAPYVVMVVNAANREKIVAWLGQHKREGEDVQLTDQTWDTGMIALQGPAAVDVLNRVSDQPADSLRYYRVRSARVAGHVALVSRTGYTGEDGFELIVRADHAMRIWDMLLEAGRSAAVQPAGLGARDTLRLEAAMPLYGHELTEETNPLEAGLEFAVDLEGRQFPGADVLRQVRRDGCRRRRVGLELEGRRVARQDYPILRHGQRVGHITSGTFAPTLQLSIAMGYVVADCAEPGTRVEIDLRGHMHPARVVALPFYRRGESGGTGLPQ